MGRRYPVHGQSVRPHLQMARQDRPSSVTRIRCSLLCLPLLLGGVAREATAAPSVALEAYVQADHSSLNFGWAVAIDGDTLVVGDPFEASAATGVNGNQNDTSAPESGAAYVYVREEGAWIQQAYLKASNTDSGDQFGYSVAISGDTIVVGAHWEDSAATGIGGNGGDNTLGDSGAAYVFVRKNGQWRQQAYLKASHTGWNDRFGWSVAIDGDTLVVGAHYENSGKPFSAADPSDDTVNNAGAAYVFERSDGAWKQSGYLKADSADEADQFGFSVAISGDTIAVGMQGEDSDARGVDGDPINNDTPGSGAVYVFRREGAQWVHDAYLKASNTGWGNNFGNSVALDGQTLVVGSRQEYGSASGVNGDESNRSLPGAGAAYVFIRAEGSWRQQAYLKASNPGWANHFGVVAISGDTALVGADGESSGSSGVDGDQADDSVQNAGAAYAFVREGETWRQLAYLKAAAPRVNNFLGWSVAMHGNLLVAGAQRAGRVHVYAVDRVDQQLQINPGLNDAWINDDTVGQGFFISVFPDTGIVFLAWFTYDTELPPPAVLALLGEPGHRWVTAQGPYAGDTAELTVYLTEGGVFDAADPPAVTHVDEPIGTITIVWHDCEHATLTYDIDPPGVSGEIQLRRIVPDNVALCAALAG